MLIQGKYADTYTQYALPRVFALFFNQSKNEALADENVRKALALTAPREEIVKDVLGSFGKPATSPLPTHVKKILDGATTSQPTIDPATDALLRAGSTTQEVAEALLDKAGYIKMKMAYVREKMVQ